MPGDVAAFLALVAADVRVTECGPAEPPAAAVAGTGDVHLQPGATEGPERYTGAKSDPIFLYTLKLNSLNILPPNSLLKQKPVVGELQHLPKS